MHIGLPLVFALALLGACAPSVAGMSPSDEFMSRLYTYCGQAFEGTIVSDDAADDSWRSETIIADIAECPEDQVRIPLHVGDNRSRTWIITQGEDGILGLRHQHNHEDGSPDALTMYGGLAGPDSTAARQSFPADDATKALFDAQDIPVSKQNVWAIEIRPSDALLAYELKRPERFFRVEFDLSNPVDRPPAPW